MGHHLDETDTVGHMFFSNSNISLLHEGIVQGVYKASNGRHLIGRQSQAELLTIMRSIYSESAMHLPTEHAKQVDQLNRQVLMYAIPQIISEADMHKFYVRDIVQENRSIIPHSQMTSSVGNRVEREGLVRDVFRI